MAYDVRLAKAVEKIEKDLTTRIPYYFKSGKRKVDFWECKNQDKSKIVYIIPEQEVTDTDMEVFCDFLHEHPYPERIVYTNEKGYSLGHGVAIKPLPKIVQPEETAQGIN